MRVCDGQRAVESAKQSPVGGDKFRRLFLMFFKAQAACDTSRHDSGSDSISGAGSGAGADAEYESGKLLKLLPAQRQHNEFQLIATRRVKAKSSVGQRLYRAEK